MADRFDYGDIDIRVHELAYDLAKIYARAKFDDALRKNADFSLRPAPIEIEELEYLETLFWFAYEHYSNLDPGEIERQLKHYKDTFDPPKI